MRWYNPYKQKQSIDVYRACVRPSIAFSVCRNLSSPSVRTRSSRTVARSSRSPNVWFRALFLLALLSCLLAFVRSFSTYSARLSISLSISSSISFVLLVCYPSLCHRFPLLSFLWFAIAAKEDAVMMLKSLSGQTHRVFTGVTVISESKDPQDHPAVFKYFEVRLQSSTFSFIFLPFIIIILSFFRVFPFFLLFVWGEGGSWSGARKEWGGRKRERRPRGRRWEHGGDRTMAALNKNERYTWALPRERSGYVFFFFFSISSLLLCACAGAHSITIIITRRSGQFLCTYRCCTRETNILCFSFPSQETEVTFAPLTEAMITAYVETGEPL